MKLLGILHGYRRLDIWNVLRVCSGPLQIRLAQGRDQAELLSEVHLGMCEHFALCACVGTPNPSPLWFAPQ